VLLGKAAQLTRCRRPLPEVDEADGQSALLEEALRSTGGLRIAAAEDLDDRVAALTGQG
jgi:hypothetical protein